jgi:hypothetical protein
MPEPIISDMAWCWWTRPRATRIGDTAYFGALDSEGRMLAATLDLKTGASNKFHLAQFERDDHNNPALLAVEGKPLVAFYSRHDPDDALRIRISSRPLDIDEWGEERVLHFNGMTCYAQVHALGDELHLFTRVDETRWGYARSPDWAQSWSPARDFLRFDTDQQVYMATALLPDSKTMRVAVSGHPKEYEKKPLHDVWAAVVDLQSGAVTLPSSGKVIANLRDGSGLPLDYRGLELVEKTPADRTVNVMDVSDGPVFEIAFTSKIKDDHSNRDAQYNVVALRDGAWQRETVAPAGDRFGYIHAGFYVGGMAFPDRSPGGQVYVTREEGGLWSLERRDRDAAGRWQPHVLIPPGPTRLTRPWAVANPAPGLAVTCLALERYADDSYFDTLSHLVAAGDD